MFGAIIGDFIGSTYEVLAGRGTPIKDTHFDLTPPGSRITDDSVLTFAQMDHILNGGDWAQVLKKWANKYPNAGYGRTFYTWAFTDEVLPYNSWGNGSAMRVSPVGWAYETEEEVLAAAKASAEVTHSHPEGIKGAQAVALAVFLARKGYEKEQIREMLEERFQYDLSRTTKEIRPNYTFDVSCQGSVPESLICALESKNYKHAVRLAVSLGGDTDTMACIAGAVAEALYGYVPRMLGMKVMDHLGPEEEELLREFYQKYSYEEVLPIDKATLPEVRSGVLPAEDYIDMYLENRGKGENDQ